ncbi:MAG TPA: hypothetical protein VES01_09800 [Dermatophilaceae bacterium]|nr:hypothetical protein [Dermatophilaceae bacterium]
MSPDRGPIRLLRAAIFAAAGSALAAAGHNLGGAPAPGPAAWGLAAIPVTLAALWLSARRRGPAALTAGLVLVQLGLHFLFHVMSAPTSMGSARPTPVPDHPSHLATLSPIPGQAHQGLLPGGSMLGWHALAVAVTAWLLARGEDTLWRAAARLLPTWRPPTVLRWTRTSAALPQTTPRRARLAAGVYRQRAPPVRTETA